MAAGAGLRLFAERVHKARRAIRRPEFLFALRHRVLPTTEHLDVPLGPVATVLDVGASHGQFAAHARSRWPDARIVCFEPVPAALMALRRLAAHYRFEVHAVALDEHAGPAELFVTADDDSSSLLEPTARQLEAAPGARVVDTIRVERGRLDDLGLHLQRPCLLKIDVQGGELGVLRGAAATLASVDCVYVECSFVELYRGQPLAAEVVDFLGDHGFRLAGTYNETAARDGTELQADLLFRRA